ncbi:MAG: hypothetical protein R2760_10445 [Chitinophagales bacterium]
MIYTKSFINFVQVRLIFFLLAVHIIFLSATPCSDLSTYLAKESIQKTTSNSHENHGHHDDCSPFCSCTCCTTGTIAQSNYNSKAILSDSFNSYTDLIKVPSTEMNFISIFYGDIWQPPKI